MFQLMFFANHCPIVPKLLKRLEGCNVVFFGNNQYTSGVEVDIKVIDLLWEIQVQMFSRRLLFLNN